MSSVSLVDLDLMLQLAVFCLPMLLLLKWFESHIVLHFCDLKAPKRGGKASVAARKKQVLQLNSRGLLLLSF